MPHTIRAYVLSIVVVSVLVGYAVGVAYPIDDGWLGIVLLCVLALLAGNMTFDLPMAASVSLGFAMTFAGIVFGGPLAGALVGASGAVSLQEVREHKPFLLMLGNAAQLSLAAATAGVVHEYISSVRFEAWPIHVGGFVAPVLAASVFFVVNVTLVATVVALKTGMSAAEALRALGLAQYWVSLVVLALLGLVLAQLLAIASGLGLVLLVLPFMAARRTFRVFAELSEAYTSTVRSLVTALEAKDPYTRGHSERVAVYSRMLAERLLLPRPQLELLERAALLHDVGKIGVDLDTLTSPTQLTSEEVRVIRQHPVVGSELVGDVEFLADIVPIVRHHHERYDGAGYPDGLVADQIPQLARVLAVADAYDAMTSDRAYRIALTRTQAIKEIRRVAGTQLDMHLAHEFADMLETTAQPSQNQSGQTASRLFEVVTETGAS